LADLGIAKTQGEPRSIAMYGRILNAAIISGLLLATAAPAFAADEPKTKADCDKAKGKWDDKTSKCTVKK
jgi:hypothetical protein